MLCTITFHVSDAMSAGTNKAIVHQLYSAFNSKDLGALDELCVPDFVDHTAGQGQPPGAEGIKLVWWQIHEAVPGIQARIEDMLAEGDRIASRITFIRVSPNGGEIVVGTMLEIIRIVDGQAAELWNMIELNK